MQEQVIARVDLPGTSNADVSLQVHQTRLLISAGPEGAAQLLKHLEGDGHVVYRRDRGTGGFFRSVLLPGGIDVDAIKRRCTTACWSSRRLERIAMPDFSRVLCAVDFTDASRRALDCALWWARQHGADVSVLQIHRLAVPPPEAGGVAAQVPVDATLTADERQARQLELEHSGQSSTFMRDRRTDLQVECCSTRTQLSGAILARAGALAADLIVMAPARTRSRASPLARHLRVPRSPPVLGAVVPQRRRGQPVLAG
jgi:nucleotide-binding universal stress UspA family protein